MCIYIYICASSGLARACPHDASHVCARSTICAWAMHACTHTLHLHAYARTYNKVWSHIMGCIVRLCVWLYMCDMHYHMSVCTHCTLCTVRHIVYYTLHITTRYMSCDLHAMPATIRTMQEFRTEKDVDGESPSGREYHDADTWEPAKADAV